MNNSALRALTILEVLAGASGPQRLRDVCSVTGIPKSTALGILRALVDKRFAEVDAAGYRLGLRVFEVGAAYLRGISPANAVHPGLSGLAKTLDVTAHFAILDRGDVLYLEKQDPPNARVHLASAVGARLKAYHTAVGQAQLAMLSRRAVLARIGPGPYVYLDGAGQWDRETFLTRLALTRSRGYAVDDEETLRGVICLAAPVLDTAGQCCGAIGVSFPKRPPAPGIARIAASVRDAAQRASERLGWHAENTKA